MTPEIWTILGVGVALAGLIFSGLRSLLTDLNERMDRLGGRIGRLEARMDAYFPQSCHLFQAKLPPHRAERRGVSGPHDSIGILLWRIAWWTSGFDSRSVRDAPVDVKPCGGAGLDPWVESGPAPPAMPVGVMKTPSRRGRDRIGPADAQPLLTSCLPVLPWRRFFAWTRP